MKLVETFGDLDKVGEHFATLLDTSTVEYLLLAPEDGLVEAAGEVNDVGRSIEFVPRHPLAAGELVGLNSLEQGQVDQCELAGFFFLVLILRKNVNIYRNSVL